MLDSLAGKSADAGVAAIANPALGANSLYPTFSRVLQQFSQHEQISETVKAVKSGIKFTSTLWENTVASANSLLSEQNIHIPEPMKYDEARLWLQAFNAGPYALLRYKGTVPYRETRNYIPRVMKNYQRDLSNTPYEKYIVKSANKYGLDPQMIRAIMKTESDFRNKTVSHAGARGLMQVMPIVWSDVKKKYGLDWNYSKDVFEPEKNIEVACAYLAWLRYDFLPRHFEAFDANPNAPTILVRDKERGVPDRPTPRIVVDYPEAEKRRNIVFVPQTPVSPHAIVVMKESSPITLMEGKTNTQTAAASTPVSQPSKSTATLTKKAVSSAPSKINISFVSESSSSKAATAKKTKVVARNSGKRPAFAADEQGG